MKKYLTPDFDVTVYEIVDKVTADDSLSLQYADTTTPEDDDYIDA